MSSNIICPKCEVFNTINDTFCWKCKRPITDEEKNIVHQKNFEEEQTNNLLLDEKNKAALTDAMSSGNWDSVPSDILEKEIKKIKITTSHQIANTEIAGELEIITAEVVYGMNIFKDIFSSVRDVIGGRSKVVQNVLKDARQTVLLELRKEALSIGANAVISVDLDYQEISGGGKNGMIMLVASGTAVLLEK
jgi:uncharacterized protein YbjQ (UPF0145 family)